MSRGQNELLGEFKMAAGDVISIRGQVIEYTYIPTGIKIQLTIYFIYKSSWKLTVHTEKFLM